jgi:hypothetical protein
MIQSQSLSLFQCFKIVFSSNLLHISIDHSRCISLCHLFAGGELDDGIDFDVVHEFQEVNMLMLINRRIILL